LERLRSALYVPADRPRALDKACGLDADVLILDLEDAVVPEAKAGARAAAVAALPGLRARHRVVIRINGIGTPWHDDDMAAVAAARPDAVLLPKVMTAQDVADARAGGVPVWAMIETPRAALAIAAIAASGAAALVLGANDLIKEMGGRARSDGANLYSVMTQLVLAARTHGIAALDGVFNGIGDEAGFAQACALARDFGFDGKTLIHPGQIVPAHAAFTPGPEAVAAAQRILEAFAANPGQGALLVDGQMVERLHADMARRTLALAGIA